MAKSILLLTLFTATLPVGCVDISKPKVVELCAAAHNCSNDPTQQPGPDANKDTERPGPDLPLADMAEAKADLGPDSPLADTPADQIEQGGDTKDVAGTDAKETGTSFDADSGLPPADVAPDVAPDMSRQDVVPDLAPDLKPDLTPDLTPDTSTLASGLLAYYKCESATGTTLQ
ncbi:MAG TPA: hypothetical protein VF524_08650, partial [Polyangia bacterium]